MEMERLRKTSRTMFLGYPDCIAIGDLDGDLDLDLAATNSLARVVSVLMNNGDGTFAPSITYEVGSAPEFVAMGDLDGDLDLELVTTNFNDKNVSVLMNNGDGTFATQITYAFDSRPLSVAIADLDGDLDADLVVTTNTSSGVTVLLNNGDGTFVEDSSSPYQAGNGPDSFAVGDLDGDLDLDLATANRFSDNVSVLLNSCVDNPFVTTPSQLTVFRGVQIDGTLEDVFESDDSRIRFNPGFTINSSEAPVWLIFDGTLPSDSPTGLQIVLESQAGTPGLTSTLEAWNWTSATYDVVDVSMAEFNNDEVVTVDLSSGISDYVESATGAVQTRVGWRKTGFTINYPWEVRMDQMVWLVD